MNTSHERGSACCGRCALLTCRTLLWRSVRTCRCVRPSDSPFFPKAFKCISYWCSIPRGYGVHIIFFFRNKMDDLLRWLGDISFAYFFQLSCSHDWWPASFPHSFPLLSLPSTYRGSRRLTLIELCTKSNFWLMQPWPLSYLYLPSSSPIFPPSQLSFHIYDLTLLIRRFQNRIERPWPNSQCSLWSSKWRFVQTGFRELFKWAVGLTNVDSLSIIAAYNCATRCCWKSRAFPFWYKDTSNGNLDVLYSEFGFRETLLTCYLTCYLKNWTVWVAK